MIRNCLQAARFGLILAVVPAAPAFAQQGEQPQRSCEGLTQGSDTPVAVPKRKKGLGLMGVLRAAGPLGGMVGGAGGAAASSALGVVGTAATVSENSMPRLASACGTLPAEDGRQQRYPE